MADYYWVPLGDKDWLADTRKRIKEDGGDGLLLPYRLGQHVGNLDKALWSDIQAGDSITIAAHGHKYTTEKVSWIVSGETVSWSSEYLASALHTCMGNNVSFNINYYLLACFGANNITPFAPSFGKRFAASLKAYRFRGTLTAYKGATGMNKAHGFQTGSSRITAAPSFLLGDGAKKEGTATYDAGVTWQL